MNEPIPGEAVRGRGTRMPSFGTRAWGKGIRFTASLIEPSMLKLLEAEPGERVGNRMRQWTICPQTHLSRRADDGNGL